jgi:hypothetical protein
MIALGIEAVNVFSLHLLGTWLHEERLAKRIAKANVRKPALVKMHKQGPMVELGANLSRAIHYSRGEHDDVEA